MAALGWLLLLDFAAGGEPEPEKKRVGVGAGEGGGREPERYTRRRREEKPIRDAGTRRNVGPTFDEPEVPDEAVPPRPEDQTEDERLAQLEALQKELTSDEGRVVALEGQLERIEAEIEELRLKRQINAALLLLLME